MNEPTTHAALIHALAIAIIATGESVEMAESIGVEPAELMQWLKPIARQAVDTGVKLGRVDAVKIAQVSLFRGIMMGIVAASVLREMSELADARDVKITDAEIKINLPWEQL
jgi:hypothetical protein